MTEVSQTTNKITVSGIDTTVNVSPTAAGPNVTVNTGVNNISISPSAIASEVAVGYSAGERGYYGAFSDYTDQLPGVYDTGASAINTPAALVFGQVDESNGVSIVNNEYSKKTRITVAHSGTYNIQWSGQFQCTDTQDQDVSVWLRKNGTIASGASSDVVGSTGLVAIPSTHGGVNGHTIAGWNFVMTLNSGDYLEFFWSATSTSVSLQHFPVYSTPTRPSTASLVLTVTQVGNILEGGVSGGSGSVGVLSAIDPIVYASDTQTVSANTTSLRTISRQAATNPLRSWHRSFANARYGSTYGLNGASSRVSDILVIGDSITEGYGANTIGLGTSWIRRFSQLLAESANTDGRTGVYIPCSEFDGLIPAPKWVSSGTTSETTVGLGRRSQSISAGGSMTLTVTGTSATVFYRRAKQFPLPYNHGAIRIRVYEGSGTGGTLLFDRTQDTYEAGLTPGSQILVAQEIPISAWGSRKTATIVVSQETATDLKDGPVLCDGAYIHDGTETVGTRVWCSGKAGSAFSTWNSVVNDSLNTDWLAIMRTHITIADASASPVTQIGAGYLQPSLVVIALGSNENTTTPSSIKLAMQTLVNNINNQFGASVTLPSFAFMINPTNGTKTDAYWAPIVTAMYEQAEAMGCAIWDWSSLFGSYSTVTGDPFGWSSDNLHPNNGGHIALGDFAAREALSGVSPIAAVEGFGNSISASGIATWDSSTRTITVSTGTTAATAAAGNDSRLSNARTPTAHASSHQTGGTDPLTATNIGGVPLKWKAGTYIRTPMGTTAIATNGLTVNRSFCTGLYVPRGGAIDRVGIEVTTVGGTGSVVRIGLYADSDGLPGTLLFDAGTIDTATAIGYIQATVNWTGLNDGLYWIATVPQVGTPAPVVRSVSTPLGGLAPYRPTSISNNPDAWGVYGQNMTGALASTFTFTAAVGPPLILVRCA